MSETSTKARKPSLTNKVVEHLGALIGALEPLKTEKSATVDLEGKSVRRGVEYLIDLVAWHKATHEAGEDTDPHAAS